MIIKFSFPKLIKIIFNAFLLVLAIIGFNAIGGQKYVEMAKIHITTFIQERAQENAKKFGNFEIIRAQSIIYVEPQDDFADIDGMFDAAMKTFGIIAVGRAAVCEKNLEDIKRITREYIPQFLEGKKTFKVESKRADKRFPLKSPEISAQVGGLVLSLCHNIKVDVHNPDVTVTVEIRDDNAYIRAGQEQGAGGLPLRSAGRGLLLLSGGIDSPVAGYRMLRRGMTVDCIYFHAYPYTSDEALQKVELLYGSFSLAHGDAIHVRTVLVCSLENTRWHQS